MREGPDSESENRIWGRVPGGRRDALGVVDAVYARACQIACQWHRRHAAAQPQAAGAQGADRFRDSHVGKSAGDSHLVKGGQGREPDELTETAGSLLILYVLGANALLLCAVVWWLW